MMASNPWDAGPTEDDFSQFLNMSDMNQIGDNMQFDFSGFPDGGMMARPRDNTQDTIMGNSDGGMNGLMGGQTNQIAPGSMAGQLMTTQAPGSDSISSLDAQIQYLQQQKLHQQQRQLEQQQRTAFYANANHSVPPTPQSLEMPPGSGNFYTRQHDQIGREVYDHGYQQRMKEQQDMAFTPLVSPAVTPLDPHFNMENAFASSSYFSPLTSPALHAQTDSSSLYDHSTHSNNSPVEMDLEQGPAPVAQVLDLSKKARKNNAAKTRGKQSIKSSPITKPQRKKTGPSPAIVSHVLSEFDERKNVEHSLLPLPAASTDGSEDASVSPENLNDMPPPPIPNRRSTSKSPYIRPQSDNSQTPTPTTAPSSLPDLTPHPATPASLMKLPASKASKQTNAAPNSHEQDQVATEHIESLELPEAVSNKQFTPIITNLSIPSSTQSEPGSAQGQSFQALPSLVSNRPGTASATQSPQIHPKSTGPSARKTPQLAPRNARKRSMSSVHVSPALLPRISPNIKPLLPSTPGMTAEDAASRLLTTKSNYQNMLEGNRVPGISYPSELSTNINSKRTSHKIAEQGRRNRINSALQIMASMLPDAPKETTEDEEKKDSKQANAANSKASVVENAIVHMKKLEEENSGLRNELEALKAQLDKLKAPS